MRKTFLILPLLIAGHWGMQAQEQVISSGAVATGSGGSSSYTIGQVFYHGIETGSGSISQGVQQAYVISVTTNVNNTNFDLKAQAYPNPTTDFLQLNVSNTKLLNNGTIYYQVYNTKGALLQQGNIESQKTNINMAHYVAGVYFVNIQNNTTTLKSFKIIKK